MIYLDSSALVKRYVSEDGSDRIDSILAFAPLAATSKLTYPEIVSAFSRKHAAREIPTRWFNRLVDHFEADWDRLVIVEIQDDLLPLMKTLIKRHRLRAADSVHLATALWLGSALRENVTFVSSDLPLLAAAGAERLSTVDPRTQGIERD